MTRQAEQRTPLQDAEEPATDQKEQAGNDASFDETILSISKTFRLTPQRNGGLLSFGPGSLYPYIRDELVISRETAATHAKHIYAKLDVHNRQELIDLVAKH